MCTAYTQRLILEIYMIIIINTFLFLCISIGAIFYYYRKKICIQSKKENESNYTVLIVKISETWAWCFGIQFYFPFQP